MTKTKLTTFNLAMLGMALTFGATNTASAATANSAAPAKTFATGSKLSGLELGAHANGMVFIEPLGNHYYGYNSDFNPVIGYVVAHVGYAVKINRVIDLVPELNLGMATTQYEEKSQYGWSSSSPRTAESSMLVKAGVQFRVNTGRVFSTYVGPQVMVTSLTIPSSFRGNSKKSYTSFGAMAGMGFTVASHFMIDVRIDAVKDIVGLAAGFVYKF